MTEVYRLIGSDRIGSDQRRVQKRNLHVIIHEPQHQDKKKARDARVARQLTAVT